MEQFENGKTDILVATSVVEVGVNVPNATIIVIEGAERFGMAQLHQLRGRVLRSTHQAYCYLFAESKGVDTKQRLSALISAKNGFELAEKDLEIRGEGTLSGKKQWGLSDVGMEAIKNIKMVEAAREEAKKMIERDPTLNTSPLLKKAEKNIAEKDIHFE
jgi:ATP-dependent DNA helicase RecG